MSKESKMVAGILATSMPQEHEVNFTTPDQAAYLLEIGLPIDSADAYYYNFAAAMWNDRRKHLYLGVFAPSQMSEPFDNRGCRGNVPCWSVGQLIRIYKALCSKAAIKFALNFLNGDAEVECMIRLIEDRINELKYKE